MAPSSKNRRDAPRKKPTTTTNRTWTNISLPPLPKEAPPRSTITCYRNAAHEVGSHHPCERHPARESTPHTSPEPPHWLSRAPTEEAIGRTLTYQMPLQRSQRRRRPPISRIDNGEPSAEALNLFTARGVKGPYPHHPLHWRRELGWQCLGGRRGSGETVRGSAAEGLGFHPLGCLKEGRREGNGSYIPRPQQKEKKSRRSRASIRLLSVPHSTLFAVK
jgi:hypothetical protein